MISTLDTQSVDKNKMQHVFITGASGCVGHYLIKECLKQPNLHLHLLVRHPEKLQFSEDEFKRFTIHKGDFKKIEVFKDVIFEMDYIIHCVTEWWGADQTHLVNVTKTKELFMSTNPERLKHIVYFSTASLLGKGSKVVKEAKLYGSDYIKSKYDAYHMIQSLPLKDKITTVFPTMVFGGDATYPQSHITKGVNQAFGLLKYIRFISVDGAFHFIHSADIATLAVYFLLHPRSKREYVLGNVAVTVKEAIDVLTSVFKLKIWFRVHVTYKFILRMAAVFRIKIGPWERYCIDNPFMVFDAVNPKTFGLKGEFEVLSDVVRDIKTFSTK